MKKVIMFILFMSFFIGCTSNELTYTLPEPEDDNKWDAAAYQRWLKGK